MSQNNPIRLFVTHAWETSDEYLRIFEYLESARNFFYKNSLRRTRRPAGGKEADREELRRQIAPGRMCDCPSGFVPATERTDAVPDDLRQGVGQAGDPHAAVRRQRRAAERDHLAGGSDRRWDGRALVDAIKAQARHEESHRWDTIEFKLD